MKLLRGLTHTQNMGYGEDESGLMRGAKAMKEPETVLEQEVESLSIGIYTIAAAAMIWLLTFASEILIPIAIAGLIWALINALASAIGRLAVGTVRSPSWLSMTLAILIVLAGLFLVGNVISESATNIASRAPEYQPNIDMILPNLFKFFGFDPIEGIADLTERIDFSDVIRQVALALSSILGNAVIILVYVGFLLLDQGTFRSKLRVLIRDGQRQTEISNMVETLSNNIQEYLWLKTLMSLATALFSYGVMEYYDLDFSGFWAFLIFLLNYIPTVGSILGVVFPAVQALVQTGDAQTFFSIVIILGLLPQFFIGNVIEPKIMGNSLNLSPLVIILSLAFWGGLWGVPGLFVSVPLTVIVMIVSAHFDRTRWLAVLLSSDGEIVERVRGGKSVVPIRDSDPLDMAEP